MRSIRKVLALVLVAAIAMLSGCTGSKKDEGPVKISFWHGMSYDSSHGKTLQELVKKFNESQAEIVVEEIYQGGYGDVEKKTVAAIAAKTPPTIVQNTDSMLTNLVRSKAVMDLTPFVPAPELGDYPKALLEAQSFDGKLYALPFNKSMVVLIFDKKLVPNPPTNWEEFREVSKQLSVPSKLYGTAFEANVYYFGNHFVQAGGEWINKEGKAAFNSEAGVQALQFIVDMSREGSAIQLKPREYQSNYFNEGRAAMIATTSASFAFIKPNNGNPWGVAPLYAGPKNDLTGLSGANVSIVNGVTPGEAKAAATFLLWLTGKEGTLQWAMAKTGYMPVRKSAYETPQWKDFVKANPEYEVLGAVINKGTVQPNHPQWGSVQKLITTAVESAVLGKATPKEALDEAAKAADELLAKK